MTITLRTLFAATLLLSLAIIGYVQFAEHVQYYEPCELCLRERLPWYFMIGLSLIGLLPRRLTLIGLVFPSRWLLVLIGLTLLVSAGLGLHHAGVEQHWWPGPAECTGGGSGAKTVDELRAMMMREKVVQCDQIAWKLFGLSMAAYNFLVSLVAGLTVLFFALRGRHAV
jgi:disulfide bond formation protein DsbB